MTGPQPVTGRELVVDPAGAGYGRRWVCWATRRACQAGTSSRLEALPQQGVAVA